MAFKTAQEIEELFATNAWWKKLSDEVDRIWRVKNIPDIVTDESKAAVVDCLFEFTEITEEKFASAENDQTYLTAKQILMDIHHGDEIPPAVYELYKGQIPVAVNQIDALAKNLGMAIENEDLRNEVSQRWHESRKIPFQELRGKYQVESLQQRSLLRKIEDLRQRKGRVQRLVSPFEPYALMNVSAEGSSRSRAEYLAYRVYDPLWTSGLHEYEPEYLSFPLGWAGSLFPSSRMKGLYQSHKAGKDVISILRKSLERNDQLDEIENSIKSCPITERHGQLISESIRAFKQGFFLLTSRALLSVIEGMIWDFAWWWNRENHTLFPSSVSLDDYRRLRFRLLDVNGKEINTEPTIGLLLRNSRFGDEFYFEFVEYYCEELFRERNPALHGRDPDFGDENKASLLLLCVKVLEKDIFEAFSKWFADHCITHYEKSVAAGIA